LTNIEEARGSSGNDEMHAASVGSRLEGRGGNDELYGNSGTDRLYGGDGNDYIDPGENDDFDVIETGSGIDTVDFGGIQNGWFSLEHRSLLTQTALNVVINAPDNTGTVGKGTFGQTTLIDVQSALQADGLGILGTDLADSFNITLSDENFIELQAGRGADTYTIAGSGTASLRFDRDGDGRDATQALVADFSTGVISNDGFGFRDTLSMGPDVRLEVQGTRQADNITGTAQDDSFTPVAGNDTIHGGNGFDVINYSPRETGAVQIDLAAGTAQGSYNGQAFTTTFSSIEGALGSRFGNDRIKGSAEGNYLSGRGGDDALYGDGYRSVYDLDDARAVYRLYQATLDRVPDAAGQAGWTELLATDARTLAGVAAGFVGSAEFQSVYGALSNAAFVELLYQNVLGRAADAGGLAGWTNALAGGTSRAQVVTGFS
jgi:hypothetical protein